MSVRIFIDVDDWLDALDAHAGPGTETKQALNAVLQAGFEETQAIVHVITGSLKASGRTDTSADGNSWEGEIRYGGPAPGYAHPYVFYATEELNRHDYFRNLHLLDFDFEQALYATVRARLT